MSKNNLFFKPVVYLGMAIYIALSYTVLALGNRVIGVTVPEDRYFEIVGGLALLATSFLFLYGFGVKRKSLGRARFSLVKQLVYLGLAALFFFGAGEEFSWGQRIFGFQTPQALAQVNKQDELNLHNLSVLENSQFFTADRMFDAFWFVFTVLIPAVALIVPVFKRFAAKLIPVVPWGIGLMFLYNYFWAKLAKLIYATAYIFDRIPLVQAVHEIKESNYAVLFILVGLFSLWEFVESKEESSAHVKPGTTIIEPALDR